LKFFPLQGHALIHCKSQSYKATPRIYKATALPAGGKVIVVAENLPGYETVKELMLT
jgi:hypothetical protein